MKRIAFLAAAAAVITGCATPPKPNSAYDNDVDTEKVAAIERNARANGIHLVWLRYPERKAKPADAMPPPAGPAGG